MQVTLFSMDSCDLEDPKHCIGGLGGIQHDRTKQQLHILNPSSSMALLRGQRTSTESEALPLPASVQFPSTIYGVLNTIRAHS